MRQEAKNPFVNNAKAAVSSASKKHNLSRLLCASAAFVLSQASNAYANPTGAQVVAGNINISTPSAGNLVVNQGSDKAIINWKNFDILNGESTKFVQPSSNSVALNRITDGNPTQILGSLSANGKLMVVNPSGVFFGKDSRVDVAGLIASTADTTDADFLAGKVNLSVAGKADAAIINKGTITAADGGLVALVAPSVRNDGVIQANLGTVALASAQTASVDFYGDNLYSFALDKEATATASGVDNSGIVSVGSGKVLMTAKVAKGVVDNVINNTGIIEASSAHMEGGTVVLDGGDGNVKLSGKINASGKTGGKVTVTGENITLAAADINASGKNGGGSVKIGGDYQGGGTLAHAKKVSVDSDSKIDVSATDTGNGGTSVVWSDEVTDFNGSILGTGGVNGGNGGLAEVSSHGDLGYNGTADLHAFAGEAGTLLLDPNNLYIGAFVDHFFGTDHYVNFAPIAATLQGGTNVVESAINNVSLLADLVWSGIGSLTINAGATAVIEADIRSSFAGASTKGAVTINAANSLQMGNADISTKGGKITVNTNKVKLSNSTIKSQFSDVDINNTGRFGSTTANVLSGKTVTLHQDTTGFIQNAIDAVGDSVNGALLILGTGTWTEAVTVDQSKFTIQGQGAANTKIQAPASDTFPVVNVNGQNKITLTDLAVEGGYVAISANGTNNFKLLNSKVSDAAYGLDLETATNPLISNNTFENNGTGIFSNAGSTLVRIYGNSFNGNNSQTGIVLQQTTQSRVDNSLGTPNTFNGLGTGVYVSGGSSDIISHNNFNDVYNGVWSQDDAQGLHVTHNNFAFNSEGGVGGDAIHNEGGKNFTASYNTIDDYNNGIVVLGTNSSSVLHNTITNIWGDGIFVGSLFISPPDIDFESFFTLAGIEVFSNNALIDHNTVTGASTGIHVAGVNQATVSNNTVTDTFYGLYADTVTGLRVIANELRDSYIGSDIYSSADVVFNNNNIHDNTYGAYFAFSDGLSHNTNSFTNNYYGTYLYSSNNATLTGDTYVNNNIGITVNNSVDAFIDAANITNPVFDPESEGSTSIGIDIVSYPYYSYAKEQSDSEISLSGSLSNALVRGTTITGGDIGVLVDGAGSSMQFLSDTSDFSNMNHYFILQNDAMFAGGSLAQADSLDASQQTFDGIRGEDFTPADLAAAEGITTDVEDGIPTIGNVFYKAFPVVTTFSLFGTDNLSRLDDNGNVGLFSYAGRTITNNPGETPPAFDINGLNLSLLSPSAGGTTPPTPPTGPQGLAGLEPAAGGDNQQALASLEPAAGGEPNCGNNFLGSGFSTSFDAATCNTNQQ